MMKLFKYLVFTVSGLMLTSCGDFLNPEPDTAVTVGTFFQSDDDVLAGIIGIYDGIQGVNENTNTNENEVNRGVQFEYLLTEHRTDNTRGATLEGSKADFHRYLVDPNNVESDDYWASMYEIIFRANNILNFMDVANAANVPAYTAEVKFLRAYAYFNLVRLYGEVPLVTEVVIASDEEALFTRRSVDQVYAQIVADLEDAVADLDNTHRSRASRAAAQGLLAKAYLSQPTPNYTGAREMCEAVINGGEYTLLSEYHDDFYNELNDEVIFAIQYQSANTEESQSFSSEFTSAVRAGREDGLNIPNENLIADLNAFGGNRTETALTNVLGSIEVGKFLPDGFTFLDDYGPSARNAGNDWIILRYADILLMHAAAIMAGAPSTGDGAALSSFQQVRDRAGLTTPVTTITSDDLLLERRVEFAFENQRLFDLQRFGVADAVLSAHATEMGYSDYSARALLLPIPAREINLSKGILTQNPGY